MVQQSFPYFLFVLDGPATVEKIQIASGVGTDQFTL